MADPRITKLAEILVNHSTNIKKREYVQIVGPAKAKELILELYKLVIQKGAYPLVRVGLSGMDYIYYKNASREQLKKFPGIAMYEAKKTQVYISIYGESNTRELANIDPKKIAIRQKVTRRISDYIVNNKDKIRRVSLNFPTNAFAQDAEMSLNEYEDFFFNATNQDWKKLSIKYNKIKNTLNKGKEIRIVGEDTDLRLKIYKKSFVVDDGKENMPGGELFCAPEKYSVEGHIRFTYPAIRNGTEVRNIYTEFKKGKCIKATADKNEKFLKTMLNTDQGSSYIGELGIGLNPKVTIFTKDLLFDEKKMNSIHLAFGMAYKECGQPNKSALHWDIVKDMSKGVIYLDGKKIYVNGKWLI